LYTAQKSNSHYAPQPYTYQSVFKSLLNSTNEISLSRNATGREFQRHGRATEKLLECVWWDVKPCSITVLHQRCDLYHTYGKQPPGCCRIHKVL